jgi:diguanylate cyclase (GGDEF)-like protein
MASVNPVTKPGRTLPMVVLGVLAAMLAVWHVAGSLRAHDHQSHLLTGEIAWDPAPVRPCPPEVVAGLDTRVEIPPPDGGWPGVPQAVDVFNVFSGEVMIAHGDRMVCGRMHDAASRDSRFRAGVGMVVVPYAGATEPIRLAWTRPLMDEWVPTVRMGTPSLVQQHDMLRLVMRAATLAVAIAMGFTALMGFLTTRDRVFFGFTLLCMLMVLWQAILSGLTGYPQPWLPVDTNEPRWLAGASSVGLAALLFSMWMLVGGSWMWKKSVRVLLVACVMLGLAGVALSVLLPIERLREFARWADYLVRICTALVFVVAIHVASVRYPRVRIEHRGAVLVGPLALIPFMGMGLLELTGSSWLVEYRMEAIQFCITWFLTVGAYVLNLRLGRLRRQRDEMQVLADTDALTGLSNRRAGLRVLEQHVAAARQAGGELTVGFLDVDLFKQINDEHGHEVGDQVLVEIARVLLGSVRSRADAVRMGGEEFLLMLPGVDLDAARSRLEGIRGEVATVAGRLGVPGLEVTASIGVASLVVEDRDAAALLRRADGAMYQAKRSGRDRVVVDQAPVLVVPRD